MEIKMIDVSAHQGTIDWLAVREHVDGVIIRCGYGKNITSQDDKQFVRNVEACIKYGIPFGVYIYSYAKTVEDAKSEAAHVLRLLAPYKGKLSYPVYYDLEEPGTEKTAVERAIVFGDIIEAEGYWCGIYANQYWWKTHLKGELDRLTKWVAKYSKNKPTGISGTYDIWQYSKSGSVPGINGNVDLNICYRDFPKEIGRKGTESEESPMKYYHKGQAVQVSKNFKSTEFDCKGKGCCNTTPIHADLVKILQQVRDHFGVSVNLNCGYRCPTHNAKVSGASANSQHMKGIAADIVVKGVHPMRVARFIETIPEFKGRIGCYTWNDKTGGFVHVDVRGTNSRAVYTDNNTAYDTLPNFNVSVKRGMKGKIVKVVQRKLRSEKLYFGFVDGKCGSGTEKAIIKFNAKHGRQNDASWGRKCWNEAFPIEK